MGLQLLQVQIWFYLCKRKQIDGIDVGVFTNQPHADLIRKRLTAALSLLRDNDPRRFAYLQRDVKRIMVFGDPRCRGRWFQGFALCELTESYVIAPETTPAELASTLAHEAMHARLYRWGFGYQEEQRVRIERICFKASMAFARRLPDTETESREIILHQAQQQIARDPHIWTNLGSLESSLAALRELGCPGWIVSLTRGWGMFRLRCLQRSRKRVD